MVNVGRLKSPLSDAELFLSMWRKLKQSHNLILQGNAQLSKNDVEGALNSIETELNLREDIAEKDKVEIVRSEERLNSIEKKLKEYKKTLKKGKNDPSIKQQIAYIETLLAHIRGIKKKVRDEAERAMREEKGIRDLAA